MGLIYQKVAVLKDTIVDASCDRCGDDLTVRDGKVEQAGVFTHSFSWYSPSWSCGDMSTLLCESCIEEVFHFGTFTPDQC